MAGVFGSTVIVHLVTVPVRFHLGMCAPQPLQKEKQHGGVKTAQKQTLLPQATAQDIKGTQNALQMTEILLNSTHYIS